MGSLGRPILLSATGVLVAGILLVAAPSGAVPAKSGKTDPCSLITDTDVGGLSTSWTLDKTDGLSGTNCLYYLQGDGEGTTINLFVDKPADFSIGKAGLGKRKKVAGLSSGYSGTLPGDDVQIGFKNGSTAIRVTSEDLSLADMVLVAKAVNKHV